MNKSEIRKRMVVFLTLEDHIDEIKKAGKLGTRFAESIIKES